MGVRKPSARVKFDRTTTLPSLLSEVAGIAPEANPINTQVEVIQYFPVVFRAA